MTTVLPSSYQQYYIYKHIDPRTQETIYIGKGQKDRAWHYRVSMSRKASHTEFLTDLEKEGFLPCDWVVIMARNLTEEQASSLEKDLIKAAKPKFNLQFNDDYSRIDEDLLVRAKELKDTGVVGRKAAKLLEVSVMTTWRYQYEY